MLCFNVHIIGYYVLHSKMQSFLKIRNIHGHWIKQKQKTYTLPVNQFTHFFGCAPISCICWPFSCGIRKIHNIKYTIDLWIILWPEIRISSYFSLNLVTGSINVCQFFYKNANAGSWLHSNMINVLQVKFTNYALKPRAQFRKNFNQNAFFMKINYASHDESCHPTLLIRH